ncbi:MAG: hypothetical protein ACREMA_08135 [Longimicrobiales bacterium]
MVGKRLVPFAVLVTILFPFLPTGLSAQQTAPPIRSRFGVSIAAHWNVHGYDPCRNLYLGAGAGAEVRTRGKWLIAGSLDLLTDLFGVCEDGSIPVVSFQGQPVDEFTHEAIWAPRLGLRVGRAFGDIRNGRVLEVTPSVGVLFLRPDFPNENKQILLSPSYGALLTRRGASGYPRTIFLEVGARHVPHRYYHTENRQNLHEFTRMGGLVRIGLGV